MTKVVTQFEVSLNFRFYILSKHRFINADLDGIQNIDIKQVIGFNIETYKDRVCPRMKYFSIAILAVVPTLLVT